MIRERGLTAGAIYSAISITGTLRSRQDHQHEHYRVPRWRLCLKPDDYVAWFAVICGITKARVCQGLVIAIRILKDFVFLFYCGVWRSEGRFPFSVIAFIPFSVDFCVCFSVSSEAVFCCMW